MVKCDEMLLQCLLYVFAVNFFLNLRQRIREWVIREMVMLNVLLKSVSYSELVVICTLHFIKILLIPSAQR